MLSLEQVVIFNFQPSVLYFRDEIYISALTLACYLSRIRKGGLICFFDEITKKILNIFRA